MNSPATATQISADRTFGQVGVEIYVADSDHVAMSSSSIAPTGGSQGHPNMMPSLGIHFIIALVGIYPSRH